MDRQGRRKLDAFIHGSIDWTALGGPVFNAFPLAISEHQSPAPMIAPHRPPRLKLPTTTKQSNAHFTWIARRLAQRARDLRDGKGSTKPLVLDARFLVQFAAHATTKAAANSTAGKKLKAWMDGAKTLGQELSPSLPFLGAAEGKQTSEPKQPRSEPPLAVTQLCPFLSPSAFQRSRLASARANTGRDWATSSPRTWCGHG